MSTENITIMPLQQYWPQKPYFVDTTLRDGEQAPGVAFSVKEKVHLATLLAEIGVDELEVGSPAISEEEREAIRQITSLGLPCRTSVWCRACREDIELAAYCNVDTVHVSLPTSDLLLKAMGKDRRWVWKQLENCMKWGTSMFERTSIGLQDASRADINFLTQLACAADFLEASRIRISDTVGILNPSSTKTLVCNVKALGLSSTLGFHAHNDFGLATANTLAAWEVGVEHVDVTVGGLGERAGNAALEQIAMALQISYNVDTNLKTTKLAELARVVSRYAGHPIPLDKPLVGQLVFSHESGIHIRAMSVDTQSYQPLQAEELGRDDGIRFIIGKHSGKTALRHTNFC